MPKKSRRVAVKQAELGQRKRRAIRHPSDDEAHVPAAQAEAAVGVEVPGTATSSRTTAPDLPRRVPQQRPTPAVTPRTVNPYIWPELKRIGSITGLVVAILAVLTVVLR